ncbi:MAG: acyl-CoA desaturase [Planctomycetes bacterium]|nr:acyl-CoA desaturase [Planctomycetota bacterium]
MQAPVQSRRGDLRRTLIAWFDSWAGAEEIEASAEPERVDWVRVLPFFALHLACFAVIWVGWSPVAVITAAALYVVRMFAITAFYHRYFSHRTFETSRFAQFFFAAVGASSAQRGPLWWAAHHRIHHRNSDQPGDPHSPKLRGFWWSHCLWFTARANFRTRREEVKDLMRFPELVFLDRFDIVAPAVLLGLLYTAGALCEAYAPGLGTTGWQMFVWGIVSTIVLYHGTFTINSLAHVFGRRRFETTDTSRNSFLLALITLGEGWHNNHHRYPGTVRQGLRWWEIDVSWYVLVVLSWFGIVRELRAAPAKARVPEPQRR